jgi:hypothetical protein
VRFTPARQSQCLLGPQTATLDLLGTLFLNSYDCPNHLGNRQRAGKIHVLLPLLEMNESAAPHSGRGSGRNLRKTSGLPAIPKVGT